MNRTFLVATCLTLLIANQPSQLVSVAQIASTSSISNLDARLASLEKEIEQRRKEQNIPGLALVIVVGDRIVYVHGFGLRDVEHSLPVSPDTLFEIGSTTKAFTAMAAMISVDEGKLGLDDPPKKYLSYFKLRDADADSRVTIRDLLSHRTGLKGNDDDVWLKNPKLSREEIIRIVMISKPTAKLREKFQYNNVMYSAAGECVATAQQATWEEVIQTRIFEPLHMNSSAPSFQKLRDTSNFSQGYVANQNPKAIRLMDLSNVAPAGAIISSVRDMGQWLKVMIGAGMIDGKRLVSEKSFSELVSKQISVQENVDYGLGWGLLRWQDLRLFTHTGGTDGFSSHVEIEPDRKLGFFLLCNVPEAELVKHIRRIIWGALLDVKS